MVKGRLAHKLVVLNPEIHVCLKMNVTFIFFRHIIYIFLNNFLWVIFSLKYLLSAIGYLLPTFLYMTNISPVLVFSTAGLGLAGRRLGYSALSTSNLSRMDCFCFSADLDNATGLMLSTRKLSTSEK